MMPRAVSVRLDDDALRALARLEAAGHTRSAAIRLALLEAADRRGRSNELRAEAARLMDDLSDRAEMASILEMMEELGDPW